MKKAIEEIITVQIDDLVVSLSIIEKQNDTGLSYNERLFIIIEGKQFGYISKFKLTDNPAEINLDKMKKKIPLKKIKEVTRTKNMLRVDFKIVENKKQMQTYWNLKLKTQFLATAWEEKLNNRNAASVIRTVSPFKNNRMDSPSPQRSNFNQLQKKPSQKKVQAPPRQSANKLQVIRQENQLGKYMRQQSDKMKLSIKKSQMKPLTPKQPEQFINPLYSEHDTPKQQHKQIEQFSKQFQNPPKQQPKVAKPQFFIREPSEPFYKEKTQQHEFILSSHQRPSNSNSKLDITLQKQKSDPKVLQPPTPPPTPPPEQAQKQSTPQKNNSFNSYQLISKIVYDSQEKAKNFKLDNESYLNARQQNAQELLKMHKLELEKIKESLARQNSSKATIVQQKKIMKKSWTYYYLTKPNQIVLEQFKQYCQNLLSSIIDEIIMPQAKRKYKPKLMKADQWMYKIQDLDVRLSIMKLKDVIFDKKNMVAEKICDSSSIKTLRNQFKNYLQLQKILSFNRKLKVPLVTLCQYKGFVALFKVQSQFLRQTDNFDPIIDQLRLIQQKSNISWQTLMLDNNIILPLNSEYYKKMHGNSKQKINFDYFFIQEVDTFIPFDRLFQDRVQNHKKLRSQLLILYLKQGELISGENFDESMRTSRKVQKEKLQRLSKKILQSISDVITYMDNLEFYPLQPHQLSKFLHENGINVRYLGLIYQNLSLTFSKQIIAAQMVARCCKQVLRKTLQDIHLQSMGKQQVNNFRVNLQPKLVDFLNCLLGNSYETSALWKVIETHIKEIFHVNVKSDDIDLGYFLIALVYHTNINVFWQALNFRQIFLNNSIFTSQSFIDCKFKSQTYIIAPQQKVMQAIKLASQETEENFEKVVRILNLQTQNLPAYLYNTSSPYCIRKFLATFIQPQIHIPSQYKYGHLKLYQYSHYPIREEIQIALIQIKWHMRQKKRDKYVASCQRFLKMVSNFYGDYHPLLVQLYDLFSSFHLSNGQYEDAITFAKSSLVTILKICGTNNLKTAQAYYNLALCYIKGNKRQQALNNLNKSKTIFENNNKTDSVPYAVLLGKISLIHLNRNSFNQSIQLAQQSIVLLQQQQKQHGNFREKQKVQAYQILARCYELENKKQLEVELAKRCFSQLNKIQDHLNLQKLLKICIYPKLSSLNSNFASGYLDMISLLHLSIQTGTYGVACERIKARIQQQNLQSNLKSYLENLDSIQKFIYENKILKNWRTFQALYQRQTVNDFVSLTQQLLIFLGQGFITGALRQAL